MENAGPVPLDKSSVRYLPPTRHHELAALASSSTVIMADLGPVASSEQVLKALGQALNLPDWYGANLDALFDCLSDPDWSSRKAITLCIHGAGHLRHNGSDSLANLIETLVAVTEARNAVQLPPLLVIIDTPAKGVPPLPSR